jgi:hypothetical protein
MSRRHHGRPHHHAHPPADGPARTAGVHQGTVQTNGVDANGASPVPVPHDPMRAGVATPTASEDGAPQPPAPAPTHPAPLVPPQAAPVPPRFEANGSPHSNPPQPTGHPINGSNQAGPGQDRGGQCTAPQLRRFIKSRPYVPMHELRRRFGIVGEDDDVTPVRLDPGWVYVGLPSREGLLLGDLLRGGEIGFELSLDPRTPIVIGVYPMRPVPRA